MAWHRTGRTDPATGRDIRRRVPPRMGGFREDPEWPIVAAIEVYDEDTGIATPATILRERTVHPPIVRLGADTPDEALAVSLDELGRVDVARIAELLGVDEDQARDEIWSLVYEEPGSRQLVPAELYLSGDVRTKLEEARRAVGQDSRFERDVEALAAVQPRQIEDRDIVVRLGAPWVTTRDVEAFATEVLEAPGAGGRGPG